MEWIWNNIDETITLNHLLEQSGLSMQELTTQFMLNTRLSPLQFIKTTRKYKADLGQEDKAVLDTIYALFKPK